MQKGHWESGKRSRKEMLENSGRVEDGMTKGVRLKADNKRK